MSDGAVRVSFGIASNAADAEAFADFARSFLDVHDHVGDAYMGRRHRLVVEILFVGVRARVQRNDRRLAARPAH